MQNNQQTSQSWWRRPWFRRRASEHEQLVDEDQQQSLWDRVKSHSVILKQFLPYLWPKGRWDLRVRVVFSLLMLVIAKLVGVGAPYFYKIAVDQLSPKDGIILTIPYLAISLYGAGRLFSSISDNLKDSFFVAVTQNALRTASVEVFTHLHNLSIHYHLKRKTGTILRAVDRGTKAMSQLCTFFLFNIAPIFLDVLFVSSFMLANYTIWITLITLVVISIYIIFTIGVTEWRTKYRREMNRYENEANDKAVDSLINYETVKYFGAEEHEIKRYDKALENLGYATQRSQFSLAVLNIGQAAIIAIGQFSVMLLAAYQVTLGPENGMTAGDFVLVNTYMLQLYVPLNFLGTSYRMIKAALVDMENMFDLLKELPDITDPETIVDKEITQGEIEFKDVRFKYPGQDKEILKGISFKVPAGKQLAIVGPSGAGKSTIAKLLFRFYDTTGGKIYVDNIDITQLRQQDLRAKIGIVPQDTVLFNDTIKYNIQYGNLSASEEEVIEAAKVAHIMGLIERLPDGWNTKVGERGLRLSGGEKQRVSIARAVLKNPPIMVFDEATSALDSNTEKEIQENLRQVFKGKTTTIVLAHRLSTIIDSDEIIVVNQGVIAERGTHQELLQKGGLYKMLWDKQSQQQAKEEDQQSATEPSSKVEQNTPENKQ